MLLLKKKQHASSNTHKIKISESLPILENDFVSQEYQANLDHIKVTKFKKSHNLQQNKTKNNVKSYNYPLFDRKSRQSARFYVFR
jgi:hypothetical protein